MSHRHGGPPVLNTSLAPSYARRLHTPHARSARGPLALARLPASGARALPSRIAPPAEVACILRIRRRSLWTCWLTWHQLFSPRRSKAYCTPHTCLHDNSTPRPVFSADACSCKAAQPSGRLASATPLGPRIPLTVDILPPPPPAG